jgi:hypothetical protein
MVDSTTLRIWIQAALTIEILIQTMSLTGTNQLRQLSNKKSYNRLHVEIEAEAVAHEKVTKTHA